MPKHSNENIFVYAGYLTPGKHQLILFDNKTNIYYARDFLTDVRSCEVLQYVNDTYEISSNPKIKQHVINGRVWFDLHNSVFMNFTRITTSTVLECFKMDMQFCRMRNIVESEYDVRLFIIQIITFFM